MYHFKIVTVVLFLLSSLLGFAQQKFATHQVKEGETLYSIAKEYRVTPYSILKENPEVKSAEELKPNTVLIIPLQATISITEEKPVVEEEQLKPLGFKRHRVKKRETLFNLTQKYRITEEQLKRYNTQLYSEQLKKGMILRIPKYPEVEVVEEKALDFETYVVLEITIDSLLLLNPDLEKNSNYLGVGQELQLPRPKGDSLKEQEVALFESFIVPKAMGLFRVSQNYGISVDSIMKLNPEIAEVGGLKEGMNLRLPKRRPKEEVVNTDNYIFYQVKPKQNIFRITQNLNISRDSLFMLNPELENGLKAGMVLKLPKSRTDGLEVKNALVLDKINLADSVDIANRPKLMFLLPFRLDRIDFKNKEKSENQVALRRDVKYALGLYTGALVALDSIKKMGVSVDLKVFDTERNLDVVKSTLQTNSLSGTDAVLGPVDPKLLGEVAVQAANYNIPVIAPFASNSELSLSNVFFSIPDDGILRQHLLDYVAKKRTTEQLIIIADENHQAAKDSILSKFPMARVAKMSKDKSLHLVDFQAMLSEKEANWVFVETDKPNLVASVSSILNASIGPIVEGGTADFKVKMFTTNYNSAFEGADVSRPHLSNLKFVFPSSYKEESNDSFSELYEAKFGHAPDRFAVRGFDLTFDLLLKLAHKKNLFETSKIVGQTEYSGNKFDYHNNWTSGFYNKASYLMQYNDLRIEQITTEE